MFHVDEIVLDDSIKKGFIFDMMKLVPGDNKIDYYDSESVEHLMELFIDKCMRYGLKAQEKDTVSLFSRMNELESTVCKMDFQLQHLQNVSEELERRMSKVEFQIDQVDKRIDNLEEKKSTLNTSSIIRDTQNIKRENEDIRSSLKKIEVFISEHLLQDS